MISKKKIIILKKFSFLSFFPQWMFAWTPYCIVSLIGIFGYADNITPLGSMIPAIMAKTAACIDPYLYAVTHPRFRSEVNKIFCLSQVDTTSNFQTSYYSRGPSRRRGRHANDNARADENGNTNGQRRGQLDRAESSFCDDSTISMDIPVKC